MDIYSCLKNRFKRSKIDYGTNAKVLGADHLCLKTTKQKENYQLKHVRFTLIYILNGKISLTKYCPEILAQGSLYILTVKMKDM